MNFWLFGPVEQKVTISFYSAHSPVKQCTRFTKVSSASSPKPTGVLITTYVRGSVTGCYWVVRRQESSQFSLYYEGCLCFWALWVVQVKQYCNLNCTHDMQFAHEANEQTISILWTRSVFPLTTAPIFVPLLLSSTAHLGCRLCLFSPWTPQAFHRDVVVLWRYDVYRQMWLLSAP